jgi:hypothetical protein
MTLTITLSDRGLASSCNLHRGTCNDVLFGGRRTVDGQRGFISAQRVLLSVQRHFRRTSPRSWTVNEGWLFTAFSACSLRASSKSPLERGGPLAVGSVFSEARFQPCDLFKIEQSLLSSKIAVFFTCRSALYIICNEFFSLQKLTPKP